MGGVKGKMGERRAESDGDGAAAGRTRASGPPRAESWLADGPFRRLVKNAGLLVGGRSMNGVLNLIAMTLIVRSVGLETFGALAVIHAFTSAVGDIAKFQSWQAVLRYGTPALESDRKLDFRRLIKLTVLLDVASSVVGITGTCVAVPFLASRFGWSSESLFAIQLYAFSIFFMVTATPTGLLRLFDRFDLLSVSSAIGAVVRVLGGIWAFFLGADLALLLAIWFVSTAVSGAWLIAHSIRLLSQRGLLHGPRTGVRGLATGHPEIASFVATTQLNTTLSVGHRRLGTVIVGLLIDSTAAGLFDIARQVTTLLTRASLLMKPAIYPEFARLSTRGDMAGIRRLIWRSMALMAGAGTLLVMPLVIFGRPLLGFVFGSEVEAAYGLAVLLATGAGIRLLSFPLEPALISTGRAGSALFVRAASVVVFLGAMFVLIPRIGLIGAGIAMLISAIVGVTGQAIAVFVWLSTQADVAARGSVRGDLPGEG